LQNLSRPALLCLALLLLASCASVPSPDNTTTWRDPQYTGPPFRKIFVVGLSAQSLVDQRGFEDMMVSTFKSAGVDAVPGWQYVPSGRTPDEMTMRTAIAKSGADGALLVRISGFQTETTIGAGATVVDAVSPNMYVGWYSPGVYTEDYKAATIYTTLFNVATAQPVWTFNPPTYSPTTLRQDAPAFASTVVTMLRSNGLLAGP